MPYDIFQNIQRIRDDLKAVEHEQSYVSMDGEYSIIEGLLQERASATEEFLYFVKSGTALQERANHVGVNAKNSDNPNRADEGKVLSLTTNAIGQVESLAAAEQKCLKSIESLSQDKKAIETRNLQILAGAGLVIAISILSLFN